MKNGTVAILDVLGFKGIWRRHSPDDVIATLKQISTKAGHLATAPLYFGDRFNVHSGITLLSDTVVMTCAFEERPDVQIVEESLPWKDFFGLWHVCEFAATVASRALLEGCPPLAYRGAIACGEFEAVDNFIIGPAVDEAAIAEGLADAALVWLTQSAKEAVEWARSQTLEDNHPASELRRKLPLVYDYSVPLRDGRSFRTHVVNPLARTHKDLKLLVRTCLQTFATTDFGVLLKQQNTLDFLTVAEELALNDPERKRLIEIAATIGEH